MTYRTRHRQAVQETYAEVAELRNFTFNSPCWLAELGGCRGRDTAEHILREQRLRTWRATLTQRRMNGENLTDGQLHFLATPMEDILADPRNGEISCANHNQVGSKRANGIDVRPFLPPAFDTFVLEYDLGWVVETELGIAYD